MSTPLLATKLYIPPPRAELVTRRHLLDQMTAGLKGKLTLISAPAGYGKTTLLSHWISQVDRSVTWISLDDDDNDFTRFMDYLIAAFQIIAPEFGKTIPTIQDTSESPTIEMLTSLINEVSEIPETILLVLDDYHTISAENVHHVVRTFVDNIPYNLHIAVASRTDPPLRLAKLRGRGDLFEIRARDLRFRQNEAVEFLNKSMGLGLPPEDIQMLTGITEGWIAGLQLAAISLKKHPDKHSFLVAFAGSDRYIADYLLDEVLSRQPSHIQTFLLQTSILDRLCAPLCNAVTNREDSQQILTELERANLFIVPLDNQRNWYRYHHLFADLLKNHLHQIQAEKVLDLHLIASIWYEKKQSFTGCHQPCTGSQQDRADSSAHPRDGHP